MFVEPNAIYFVPSSVEINVATGRLNERAGKEALGLPVDTFLHSLAGELGKDAIAVILSGTGISRTHGAQAVIKHNRLMIVRERLSQRLNLSR